MTFQQLTDNFRQHEFRCLCAERGHTFCGGTAPINIEFVRTLQGLRNRAREHFQFDVPMMVNSGFRCAHYNATLPDSSPNSQHIHGLAADIALPRNLAWSEWAQFVWGNRFLFNALGFYEDAEFIHFDCRIADYPAYWGDIPG